MTKHQIAVESKLKLICDEALDLKIRLLIECEFSGKLWIYCDAKDKRTVIKLLRKNRVMNRKRIFAEGYNTKFLNPYPSFNFLEMDKGNNVRRLQRVRKCKLETYFGVKLYFYDTDNRVITEIINRIESLNFELVKDLVKERHPNITVNYSGSDLIFYGK